jgi:hypothetical protein
MDIPSDSKTCPVCGYEFPRSNNGLRWIALALAILFMLYFILF